MTDNEIIDDRDVLLSRIAADASTFKYASEELRSDRDVVLAAIALSGKSLRFAAPELKADREIVLEAIKKSGRALQYASPDLQADREVVMEAVSKSGKHVQYASEELRNDPQIMIAAVSETAGAMRYASESLKDDRQFVLKAIENSHGAFIQLVDRYGSDEGMVLAALGHHLDFQRREVFEKASDQLTTNRDFILRCVSEVDGELLGFVPEVFRADGDIVLAAVKHNGLALRHAVEEFRSDPDIVWEAVRQNSLALQEAAEELQTDPEITSLLRRIVPANSPIDAIVGTRRAKIWAEHGKIVICDPDMVHSKNKLLNVGPEPVGVYEVVDLKQENPMIGYFLQVGEPTLSGHEQSESFFTVTGTDVATLLVMDASKSEQVVYNEKTINWDFEGGYRGYRTDASYSGYAPHDLETFRDQDGKTRGILLTTYGDWDYPVRALYEGEGEEKSLIGYLIITDEFSPIWVWGMNERATRTKTGTMNQVELWKRLQAAFKELTEAGFLVLPDTGANYIDAWRRALEHPEGGDAKGFVLWHHREEQQRIKGNAFTVCFAGPIGNYTLEQLMQDAEDGWVREDEFDYSSGGGSTPFGGGFEILEQVKRVLDNHQVPNTFGLENYIDYYPDDDNDWDRMWEDVTSYKLVVGSVSEDAYVKPEEYWIYAKEGDAHAQYLMGGIEWLLKAASQGHLSAMKELSSHENTDPPEAHRWLQSAAEKGDLLEMEEMYHAYLYGNAAVKEDVGEAVRWLRVCGLTTQGWYLGDRLVRLLEEHPEFQYHPAETIEILERRRRGWMSADTSTMLALRYELGYGVDQDPKAAAALFMEAAGYLEHDEDPVPRYALALKEEGLSGEDFVRAIAKVGYGFERLPPPFCNYRELAIDSIRNRRVEFAGLTRSLRSDPEIALTAMRHYRYNTAEALPAELRNDRDIVRKSVILLDDPLHDSAFMEQMFPDEPGVFGKFDIYEEKTSEYWQWLEGQAQDGDPDAQYAMGKQLDYFQREEDAYEECDHAKAHQWYLKAAQQGHPQAQYLLGSNLQILYKVFYEEEELVGQSEEDALEWCTLSANQGYVTAQTYLARHFFEEQDFDTSLNWYREAASRGDGGAAFRIVEIFEQQEENLIAVEEAMKWLRLAADVGDYEADFNLALRHLHGDGVKRDLQEAVKLIKRDDWFPLTEGEEDDDSEQGYYAIVRFKEAFLNHFHGIEYAVGGQTFEAVEALSKEDDRDAKFLLGRMYDAGYGCEIDVEKAFEIYSDLAKNGHPGGQFALGRLHLEGRGTEEDVGEALQWYRLAADQGYGIELETAIKKLRVAAGAGDKDAVEDLAEYYLAGKGVEQDFDEASKWFFKAIGEDDDWSYCFRWMIESTNQQDVMDWIQAGIDRGDANFMIGLAGCYETGVIDANDDEISTITENLYRQAAKIGDENARLIFSEVILGNGKDPISEFGEKHQEALNYRFDLAEDGDPHAKFFLANMYLEGNGIEQNKAEAYRWYRSGAEQGTHHFPMYKLSECYRDGIGVERNLEEAEKWSVKAKELEAEASEDD